MAKASIGAASGKRTNAAVASLAASGGRGTATSVAGAPTRYSAASLWKPGTTWADVNTAYQAITKPAAAAPAAAPPVTASGVPADKPLPFDAQYDAEVGNAAKNRDVTLAGIGRERNDALATYGYTGTFDQSGNLVGRQFDPNNPFSRAALLKRTYDQTSRGNVNRMAVRGQLNAGSFQNLKNNTDFGYMQGEDANQKSLNALIGSLIGRQQAANTSYDSAVVQAGGSRLARALGGLG